MIIVCDYNFILYVRKFKVSEKREFEVFDQINIVSENLVW